MAKFQSQCRAPTNFANSTVEVMLMSRIGLFFLKGIEVSRHPGKSAQQACLALGGRVGFACTCGDAPCLAHLSTKQLKQV